MGRYGKLRQKILSATADANISFSALRQLLTRLGFAERIKGDHYIFTKSGVDDIINLQPQGNKAKAYQVKQIRALIFKYRLGEYDVDSL